jgi:hypothetical protein
VNQARNIRAQQFGERAAGGEFGLAAQGQGFSQAAANARSLPMQPDSSKWLTSYLATRSLIRHAVARLQNAMRCAVKTLTNWQHCWVAHKSSRHRSLHLASIDTQGAFGAQMAAQQNAYNQAMQNRSANLGGLFGLAGNLGSAYLLS